MPDATCQMQRHGGKAEFPCVFGANISEKHTGREARYCRVSSAASLVAACVSVARASTGATKRKGPKLPLQSSTFTSWAPA